MSKEKQIHEMAKEICSEYDCVIPCQSCAYYRYANCRDVKSAEKLYIAGYRKQNEGEWIDMDYYIHNKRIYKCSECSNSEAKDTLTSANYCPNCGAKMKGGAE